MGRLSRSGALAGLFCATAGLAAPPSSPPAARAAADPRSGAAAPRAAGAPSGRAPAIRFVYVRGEGAEQCPDEQGLRDEIGARLGYDPFLAPAPLATPTVGGPALSVSIVRRGTTLHGHVALLDAAGRSLGARDLVAQAGDCDGLVQALLLASSLALDPLGATRPRAPKVAAPPAPAPAAAPAAPPARPAVAPDRPRSSARRAEAAGRSSRMEVGAGLVGSAGAAPAAAMGFDLSVSERWASSSLGLEGRADLPASVSAGGGSVEAQLLFAELVPCLRRGLFGACALLAAGAEEAEGVNLRAGRHLTTFFAGAGARALADLPIGRFGPASPPAGGPDSTEGDGLSLRLWLDLLAPVARTALYVGDAEVWSSPTLSGALGLALVARFP